MRLSSILLFTSSALLACHVAATASELASVPHKTKRGDSVGHTIATNQLRGAVREEERSPRLGSKQSDLYELMRFVQENVPSVPVETFQESILSRLYSELKRKFGRKRLEEVLKLAMEDSERNEDMRLRKLFFHLRSHAFRDDKRVRMMHSKAMSSELYSPRAWRQMIEDDELEMELKAHSVGVSEGTHPNSADPQVVLQKLKRLVPHPKLPLMSLPQEEILGTLPPIYALELVFLDQKLNEMFPTIEEMEAVHKVVAEQLERRDGEPEMLFRHLDTLFRAKRFYGEKFKEEMIANIKI